MTKPTKLKIGILAVLVVFMMTTGLRCKFLSGKERELLKPVALNWWGVEDDPSAYSEVISAYRAVHPNISINYRRLREEEFEKELINALAEDRGPDIFSIRNTWLTKYLSKIEPLPEKTTLAYEVTQTSLGVKKETLIEVRDTKSLTPAQVDSLFIDVIGHDVVRGDKIYGLPLSVDTLALFYNKDLFNQAGLPLPPRSWSELQQNVTKLTFQNTNGDLTQSGAALGLVENVKYSSDILSLLMLQNGAQMVTGNRVTFGSIPPGGDRSYNPGPEALLFYSDFANPVKEVYTWNKAQPNSMDAFAQGQVAMVFGYQADIKILEAKRQGKLNFGITPVPQIENRPTSINVARYWVHTVSNKSKNVNEAWDFIQFITKEAQAKKYLTKTGKPTALRSLITQQTEDDQLNVFASQLLTAQSWYQGNEASVVDSAFAEMVNSVLTTGDIKDPIGLATQKIQQTL